MNTPFIASKLQPMPVTDSLDSERWGLADTRSLPFRSKRSKAVIHLWLFGNFTPLSPTGFMFVVYGTGGDHVDILYAWGANDRTTSMERAVRTACKLMQLDPKDELKPDLSLSIPWIRVVTEIIPHFQSARLSVKPSKSLDRTRTVDDMLTLVANLADKIDSNSSRAITYLSYPDESYADREQRVAFCMAIGNACRKQEMEAVYWPSRLWNEAIEGADLFIDANIPSAYLPAGPELWYFEEPIVVQFPEGDSRNMWRKLGWMLSAIILLPVQSPDGEAVMSLHLFERHHTDADPMSVDDMIPRVIMRTISHPNGPCARSFILEMAGIEFMQQVVPRTAHEYTRHEQKLAAQRKETLPRYSIMEVRRMEPPAHGNTQTTPDEDGPPNGNQPPPQSPYTHSFFQRRHRRRLKEPRKSDGVQVIRVAACQKLKHLPLLPEAKLKITKVSR